MEMMVKIPDELAAHMPQIIELGIRDWKDMQDAGFTNLRDVINKLTAFPSPEEVLAMRPGPGLQARMSELLEKNRTAGLEPTERKELDYYQMLDECVGLAKARAAVVLKERQAA
jgi:hypothetical protein